MPTTINVRHRSRLVDGMKPQMKRGSREIRRASSKKARRRADFALADETRVLVVSLVRRAQAPSGKTPTLAVSRDTLGQVVPFFPAHPGPIYPPISRLDAYGADCS
jgi:hypothetical protein